MQAVILLAGYGSRLGRDDIFHKSLLPFGDETLLSRHLTCLDALNIDLKARNLSFIDGKYLINEQTEIKSLDILFKKIN